MLANTLAKENGSHTPPRKPAVFLTHASPPSRIAADSGLINGALFGSGRNRRVRGRDGFNRRVSISVPFSNVRDLGPIGAPKLSACAAGIESVRYDFDKISLVTFPKGIPSGLSRKESNVLRQGRMSIATSLTFNQRRRDAKVKRRRVRNISISPHRRNHKFECRDQ
jgi:hypothetical protein